MRIDSEMGLKVKIIKIEPEATYQDKIFGYYLTVELTNGIQLPILDDFKKTTVDLLNKQVNAKIIIDATDPIIKTDSNEVFIRPLLVNDKGDFGHWVLVMGIIEEIIIPEDPKEANQYNFCILNVGIGKVLFKIYKDSLSLFQQGDSLSTIGIGSLLQFDNE